MTTEITFASLGLAEPLLRAVAEVGYTTPTPIQAQAIPLVIQGGDLLAAAQTGTGKTAGFTLPLLHRLAAADAPRPAPGRPRVLILVPTRELAAQVAESVDTYGKHLPFTSLVMFGGVNINPQISALKKPVDILIATPGRLLDHIGQKTLNLSAIEVLVLDEADRMLDMGFIRDIKKVLALLPKQRQNLLFSATFSDEIRELANGLLHNPGCVEVARRNTASELVEQAVYLVGQKVKREFLAHLIRERQWFQALVFTRTKHGANRLAEYLAKQGIEASAIHGNKSQSARTRALEQFKNGKLPVLVATDIAARGLDIEELPQVVNFELPNVPEDYVHRIGRTGRAGSTGAAISLVDEEEMKHLAAIERLIKRKIERLPLGDFVPSAAPADTEGDARPPRPPRQPRATAKPPRENRDTRKPREPREQSRQQPRPGAGRRGPAGAPQTFLGTATSINSDVIAPPDLPPSLRAERAKPRRKPVYPRDPETGEINGNVILPEPEDDEINGNVPWLDPYGRPLGAKAPGSQGAPRGDRPNRPNQPRSGGAPQGKGPGRGSKPGQGGRERHSQHHSAPRSQGGQRAALFSAKPESDNS
ncbi:MAG: DEAD/DEAH box helicase [Rhodocyclaceae bacterium]|jgi:ATP-dependent RNA helicase RhlE|nr:DEAD/DEAH box helicase [Rhodocyclaceae bacterium]